MAILLVKGLPSFESVIYMFLWFRKYTSWYDIVDWGKFGQLRDFCNFWTRELHLNSYYGGWPGNP